MFEFMCLFYVRSLHQWDAVRAEFGFKKVGICFSASISLESELPLSFSRGSDLGPALPYIRGYGGDARSADARDAEVCGPHGDRAALRLYGYEVVT
jgi:hypothetical protein